MRKLRHRAVKCLAQGYVASRQQREDSNLGIWLKSWALNCCVILTLCRSYECDPAWSVSLHGGIFLYRHWWFYVLNELTMITKSIHYFTSCFPDTAKRWTVPAFRCFSYMCDFGPTFLSYRWYLPQGQTQNELPNCLKYFLFVTFPQKALTWKLLCEKPNPTVSQGGRLQFKK